MCLACDWGRYLRVAAPAGDGGAPAGRTRRDLLLGTAAVGFTGTAAGFAATEAFGQDGATTAAARGGKADFVFRNGGVYTVDAARPWAEAVAVAGRDIVHVGDNDSAAAYIGPATRVIDLTGRMLLPGFVEAHIHPLIGAAATRGVDLQYDTRAEMLEALRAHARTLGDGEAARGFGWRYSAFPPSGPVKADLDAIWPDVPALMIAIDGHSAWVNSKALAIAGVTRDTPDPVPGFSTFARDAAGEPTGYLIEVPALAQVAAAATPFSFDYVEEALRAWLPKAAAAGITSVFDAGIQLVAEDAGFGLYATLAAEGRLPFRLVGSYYHNRPDVDPLPIIRVLRAAFDGDLVRASVLKLNMDGVDANYTAAMLAPYSDAPATRGETLLSAALVADIVRRADAEGIDVHVHAIGDRATRLSLDAVAAAIAANPSRDRRHTIAHLQGVDAADVPRFAALGVIAQFSAQWAVPDRYWTEVTTARWGKARADGLYRMGSLRRAGARVTLGTDWPAASHYSTFRPLEAIEVATTRQELRGDASQPPLPPADERLSLAEAIHANTLAAAHQIRLEGITGSITAGKRADLVVLDRNLFQIDPKTIHAASVEMTLMDGVIRHDATG